MAGQESSENLEARLRGMIEANSQAEQRSMQHGQQQQAAHLHSNYYANVNLPQSLDYPPQQQYMTGPRQLLPQGHMQPPHVYAAPPQMAYPPQRHANPPQQQPHPAQQYYQQAQYPDPLPHHQSLPPHPQPSQNYGRRGGYAAGSNASNWRTGTAPAQRERRNLYQPSREQVQAQGQFLKAMADEHLPPIIMSVGEYEEKQKFRKIIERICQEICASQPERFPPVELKGFGSLESGFATTGSDMDLVIVMADGSEPKTPFSTTIDDLPRLLEARLLQGGYGARLLTRTRVPIIKVCGEPSTELLDLLKTARDAAIDEAQAGSKVIDGLKADENTAPEAEVAGAATDEAQTQESLVEEAKEAGTEVTKGEKRAQRTRHRERQAGPLDFPKSGVGIHCDINFFNPLGLHNTELLRCYSICDSRVKPMVMFVKLWAKRRKINSSYSGTLCSYGYVLMVLHYLVNVANPPVLMNLQLPQRIEWMPELTQQGADAVVVDGWTVDFWRQINELEGLAKTGYGTDNSRPFAEHLVGFFTYFGGLDNVRPYFNWMHHVLSLRTRARQPAGHPYGSNAAGILSKEEKGWVTHAVDKTGEREVHHRYLFAIEDPFELSHNVARTVSHDGIVSIRNEFRRAQNILKAVGNGQVPAEGLLDEYVEIAESEQHSDQAKAERRPHQQKEHDTKQSSVPQQPNVTSKDAFPDLGGASLNAKRFVLGKSKKPKTTRDSPISDTQASSEKEVAEVKPATDEQSPNYARRKKTQRRPVKISEL